MKVVRKPIDVSAIFYQEGVIVPIKFRIQKSDESWVVVKVDRVIAKELEKLAGNKMWVFTCESTIGDMQRLYQLKYELDTCQWMLFKI
ncbi:hypothetical protein SAMN02745975_01746 [Geosporobacter subterraneus DSM 17957]|uniref:Uncharacterized protein n=1 Tax=Geosporobacter subterraneus DSM 17957 TaxID=1121919 RepID=A0A1M6I782_9FIRM|nr:hypothetical protein [Geosporobacter subterraneus]SHJ30331.1 hypothetical protein SAMN02745975_01746 [Geosporobacter subterraneus DSM 17957]